MYTVNCGLKLAKKSIGDGPKTLPFGDMGLIRGQRANFRISSILICTAILRVKLYEKSIGDSFRAPK